MANKRIQLLLEEKQAKIIVKALKEYTSENELVLDDEYLAYEVQLEILHKLRSEQF